MALPTLEKSWNFTVNQATAAGASAVESGQRLVYGIISALVASGWTVKGSSDSVSGAMDGVNRIASYASWIGKNSDSTARSWIVLRQPLNANMELLIEARAPTATNPERYWRLGFSSGGTYTGGSTTARPTATDELVIGAAAGDAFSISATASHVFHLVQSTDGKSLRLFILSGGLCITTVLLGAIGDPMQWITGNVVAGLVNANTGGSAKWDSWGALSPGKALVSGTTQAVFLGTIGWGTASFGPTGILGTVAWMDGSWPMLNAVWLCATPPYVGVYGRAVDLWYGPSVRPVGSTFPETGANQFAQFDHLIVPWNGTVPSVA